MKTKFILCEGGFTIEVSPLKGIILSAISSGGNKILLNAIVSSSGRVHCPKGTEGRVIEIRKPFTPKEGADTDHIFLVDFGDQYDSYQMGFQDLEYKNGSYVVQPKHTLREEDIKVTRLPLNEESTYKGDNRYLEAGSDR